MVKNPPAMRETWVWSLGWEDPLEKGMTDYPFQYSCLENLMNRGAWQATVHGVTKSWTFTFTFAASLTMLKPLAVWIRQTVENSWRDGNARPPYLPPEKPVCRTRSNVRTGHGTTDWFKIGKGVLLVKVVCCHPVYLTYLQSTSYKMLGWMTLKLE